LRRAPPGTVVETAPHGLPVRAVLHAVAVDGFYESSVDRVRACVASALTMAADLDARRVALAALATGFGRMSLSAFATAVAPLLALDVPPVSEVTICVRHADERDGLARALRLL
jgi:O-acetyl-ADP-ribose deacetylase (regulator of RNase III)